MRNVLMTFSPGSILKQFQINLPHDALNQNYSNVLLRRKGRALVKKYLLMKSPEPPAQNQNNFTEMVLMLPSTNIDKMV